MTREDFIFTIGFDGDGPVVDKLNAKKFGKLGTEDLFREGFYKSAVCSAVFSGSEAEEKLILDLYNEKSDRKVGSFAELKAVFGV
mgnify:FL=1